MFAPFLPMMIHKFFDTHWDRTLTFLRVAIGSVMLVHGSQKMLGLFGGPGFSATVAMFSQMGIAWPLAVAAIVAEFFGSLFLVAGFLGRASALGIIVVMIVAVAKVHFANGFFMNWAGTQPGEGFEYHLLAIALAVPVVVSGAGAWSVDYWLAHRLWTPVRIERRADRLEHAHVH